MITDKQSYRCPRRRQISFSDLETTSISNCRNHSPSPSYNELHSRSYRGNASPLHNLHYKYLPQNYVSPEKTKESHEAPRYSNKTSLSQAYSNNTDEIVKINSKIKNILESLEQEEKRKESYVKKYSRYEAYPSNIQADKYEIERSIGFTTPLREKSMNLANLNSGKNSNKSSIRAEEKQNYTIARRQYNPKQSNSRASSKEELKTHTNSYNLLNSRYLNYSASRVKRLRSEDTLVNGKNVDHEIDRIQEKMKELEKLKKSIGVDFKASKATEKGSEAETTLKESKQSEAKYESKYIEQPSSKLSIVNAQQPALGMKTKHLSESQPNQDETVKNFDSSSKPANEGSLAKSQFYNLKQNFNEQDVKVPKLLRNLNSKRKKAGQRVQTEHLPFPQIESAVSEYFNTNTQTPQSLETGRQLTNQLKASDVNAALTVLDKKQETNELKRLLHNLEKQIKADEQLRKVKKWFQRTRNEMKWCDLQKCLRKKGITMSTAAMKEAFGITSEEENPFYTPREQDFQMDDLVNAYQIANDNWNANILRCYSRQKLASAQLIEENIDISKRGCINIEDLVRYINYELDTFYRNRDVHLIYQRFANNATLRFPKLIQSLTHNQN